jgi:hypothetical protein
MLSFFRLLWINLFLLDKKTLSIILNPILDR